MNATTRRHYTDSELMEFRLLIDAKLLMARRTYREHRQSLETSTESASSASAHDIEDSTDSAEKEYLFNMMARQQRIIADLEAALVRIANKTYGVCQRTGELIDKARLRVVPTARFVVPPRPGQASGGMSYAV